ncbi:MAG: DNA double-strand break repair nuclease NurA [Bacillota bacterium]
MERGALVEGLHGKLQGIAGYLGQRTAKAPDRRTLRSLVKAKIGEICFVGDWEPMWEYKLVGVDGSTAGVGAGTSRLDVVSAVAMCAGGPKVAKFDVVCSVLPQHVEQAKELASSRNMPMEMGYELLVKARMAALECLACGELMSQLGGHMSLVVMDGGFLRYESLCPSEWRSLTEVLGHPPVMLVGVIEEVGTFEVARMVAQVLGTEWPSNDRELLFGLLEPGECIMVRQELAFKGDYYTVFARLSDHPQPVAIDFLRRDADPYTVKKVVSTLYHITSRSSRGVPLWLDVVDQEARLSERDIWAVVTTYLGQEVLEKLFLPHRSRRDSFTLEG